MPSLPIPQPSDGQCPCLPGHQDAGEPRGCVQWEPRGCKEGASWNQEGLCLTRNQWKEHCANEVGGCRQAVPLADLGLCPAVGMLALLASVLTETCVLYSEAGVTWEEPPPGKCAPQS